LNKVIDGFCHLLSALMVAALAIMVVLVFGNVVLRYGFNSGITVSEEVSRWLFLWMTFMGAVVALREHAHLGTDMLVSRLPPAGKKACLLVAQLAMLYVTWLLLEGSWSQMVINLGVEAPVTGASMGIFYGSGVFYAACGLVILAFDFWRTVRGRLSDRELVMVHDSEETDQVEELHLDHVLDAPADRGAKR
jgi:TRAP-type C4-dicarboxylate transport system permease small subunit